MIMAFVLQKLHMIRITYQVLFSAVLPMRTKARRPSQAKSRLQSHDNRFPGCYNNPGYRDEVAIKRPAAFWVRNKVLDLNQPMRRASRLPIVAACLLSACLALQLAAWPTAAAAADQVRIGIARTMSDVGYYVADAMGFFRDEGIEVSMTPFNSAAQMMAPLGVGDLDVGGGTVSAGFYNSVGRGIATKIVADQASMKPGYGYSSLMVRKDLVDSGRYKTLADLKGMKVAIGAPGTGTASALNETLKMGGLKYVDVDVVYLGFPEHLPAFLNKGIDAAISNEPTMTLEIEQGAAVRIVGNDVTYPDQQTAVVFYSERFIKSGHDVAERFMRAYIRGVRLYNDALKDGRLAGPAAGRIIPILSKYTSTKDEAMFRRIIPSAVNPDGEVNVAGLRRDLAFFREIGLIESKDVSADGVVDGSFVKAAVTQLGPYKAASSR
jgi:NitT/TauT family transport system substrate-binding protein